MGELDQRGELEAELQQEGDADGGDERGEPGPVAQRPVGEPLDDVAEQAADDHRPHGDDGGLDEGLAGPGGGSAQGGRTPTRSER